MKCKRTRVWIVVLAALALVAVYVPQVGANPSDPVLSIEPASLEVSSNEAFSVQVMIENVEDLGGFQIELAYDPAVVEVKQAAAGDFVGSTGRTRVPLGPQVNDEEGFVVLGMATFGDPAGADGSGVLATIDCRARGEGSSALTLRDVSVFDTAAGVITVELEEGQVAVLGTGAQPTAATSAGRSGLIVPAVILAVAGVAVLAFGLLRRRAEKGSETDLT